MLWNFALLSAYCPVGDSPSYMPCFGDPYIRKVPEDLSPYHGLLEKLSSGPLNEKSSYCPLSEFCRNFLVISVKKQLQF